MKIGSLVISGQVLMAPMAGTTDNAFRQILKKIGCSLLFTEMVSAKALVYGDKKTRRLMTFTKEQRPIGVQLFGHEPDFMAKAAEIVIKEVNPDLIDINMGCPVPKIVNNGEGSALMLNPTLAADIVKAVANAVTCPVTVKMRKGFYKEQALAVDVAQAVAEAGASMVTVHGRTREQYYSGKADWEIIKQVKQKVNIPVIGNGDVFSPQDGLRMKEMTGCDAIMIARGGQGNPWLCQQTEMYLKTGLAPEPISLEQKLALMREHLALAVDYKGEITAVKEMRSHFAWYTKGLPHATSFRRSLYTLTTVQQVLDLLAAYEQELCS